MATRRIRSLSIVAAAGATALVAGCGLQPAASFVPDAQAGSIEQYDLPDDAAVTVTSKQFTEQLILGKIAVLAASAAGFEVTDLTNVPGSVPVRELMTSGDASMTWEYTGTAWLTYLGESAGIPDKDEQWAAVRDADAANGLTWLEPAPLNNTYALAVNAEYAERTGITSVSQLADVPPEERTFCLEPEFNSRSDGFTPMLEHYGFERGVDVQEDDISILDAGAVYTATANGQRCNFGEVYTTDARIETLDLTVLEDDEAFFPSYNASAVLNTELVEQYPELGELFAQISPALDDETLIALNLQVDVEGREPVDVAYDWMVEEGFLAES